MKRITRISVAGLATMLIGGFLVSPAHATYKFIESDTWSFKDGSGARVKTRGELGWYVDGTVFRAQVRTGSAKLLRRGCVRVKIEWLKTGINPSWPPSTNPSRTSDGYYQKCGAAETTIRLTGAAHSSRWLDGAVVHIGYSTGPRAPTVYQAAHKMVMSPLGRSAPEEADSADPPTGGETGSRPAAALFAIKKSSTSTNSTEIHMLNGDDGFKTYLTNTGTALHQTDGTFEFKAGDWNHDGKIDLFAIKKSSTGTNSTEVHILNGADGFQTYLLNTGTVLHETHESFEFELGDWNADGKTDLVAISKANTGTNSTEVHILNGADGFKSYLVNTGTVLHQTDAGFEFDLGDWNADGKLDLFAVKKSSTGTNSTEVHILSGAHAFQSYLLNTGTVLHPTDATFEFELGYWDTDRKLDLFAIKKSSTGTNSTEVHILSGASGFTTYLVNTGTVLHETDATFEFEFARTIPVAGASSPPPSATPSATTTPTPTTSSTPTPETSSPTAPPPDQQNGSIGTFATMKPRCYYRDGLLWKVSLPPPRMMAVSGTTNQHVGWQGVMERWDGETWRSTPNQWVFSVAPDASTAAPFADHANFTLNTALDGPFRMKTRATWYSAAPSPETYNENLVGSAVRYAYTYRTRIWDPATSSWTSGTDQTSSCSGRL